MRKHRELRRGRGIVLVRRSRLGGLSCGSKRDKAGEHPHRSPLAERMGFVWKEHTSEYNGDRWNK